MSYDSLYGFRQRAHQYLGRAHDATFELVDAVLTTRHIYSFAELSQSPLFRRQWSSAYEALQDSRPQRQRLMRLYLEQMPSDGPIVLAGDHTGWPRPEAKRLRERTHEHQANSSGSLGPVSLGQGYSTLAWIPEAEGSWALPLRHERITSWESPISKAAFQLRQVCQHLPHRPLSLWDSEYGCASFVLKTADIEADKLMRLRSNRNLWGAPPPYGGQGRPRLHGDCFKLNAPSTWRTADDELTVVHPKLGSVRVRSWHQMHFRQAPQHPMTLIQVQRLDETGQPRSTRPLWLVWVGDTCPDLEHIWQQYLRRFALEHWYRFLKQRLHWTVPKLGEPKAAERWSDLMPLASWQLWLARDLVHDTPLPWQKSLPILTPGRVADSIAPLLARLGSPAPPPKPRGKSPGWPKGQTRNRKPRYPTVRKRASRPKKTSKTVA
ncbi:MAG: NF041680 family putative transposase [Nodosilinea sp.]